jgi:hypothetical protein
MNFKDKDGKDVQVMMNGSMVDSYINKAIHEIYNEVFMSDTESKPEPIAKDFFGIDRYEPVEDTELRATKQRLMEELEQLAVDAAKAQAKSKCDVLGNDIFQRKAIKPFNQTKDYDIVLELGPTPEQTIIKTKRGEVLDLVTDFKLDYNADQPWPTVTLTIINPKITVRPDPAVETPINDAVLQEKLDKVSIESLHNDLLSDVAQGHKVIVAKQYDVRGAVKGTADRIVG